MAEILINKIVDREALEAEKAFVLSRVKEMEDIIKAFNQNNRNKLFNAEDWKSYREAAKENQRYQEDSNRLALQRQKIREADAKAALAEFNLAKAQAKEEERKAAAAERKAAADERAAKARESANNDLSNRDVNDIPSEINIPTISDGSKTGSVVNEQELAEVQDILEANAWAAEQLAESAAKAKEQVQEVAEAIETGASSDWLDQFNGSLNDNLQLQTIFQGELDAVNAEIKDLAKSTSTAEKNSDKYTNKVAALKGRQAELKRQLSDVNGTIKLQTKEYNSAEGSLERLRARLALTQKAYDNLGDSVKKSSAGQGLLLQAQKLTNEIKAQEGATGRFQRNVGNYSSAIAKGFGKAYSGLRTLANILPGFGISGLLLAAYEGIKALSDITSKAKDRFDTLKNSRILLGEAMKESSIKDTVSNIKTLEQEIKLAKEGLINKDAVLKKYNDTIGKTTGSVKTLDEAEQEMVKNTPAYLQMLLKKTVAQKAYDKSADILLERQKAMVENTFDLQKAENEYDKIIAANNPDPGFKYTKEYVAGKKKFIDDYNEKYRQGQLFNEAKMWEEIGDVATKEAAELAKKMGFVYEQFDDKDLKKRIEAERKAAYELAKYRLQLAIDQQKSIAAAEGTGSLRIEARKKQAELEQDLAKLTHDYELKQKDLTKSGALKIGEELAQGTIEINKKMIADISLWAQLERIARTEEERKTLEAIAKLQKENDDKERERRLNDRTKSFEFGLKTRLTDLENQFEVERQATLDQYKAGKISKEKYEKDLLAIQNKYSRLALEEEINYYANLITISGLSDEEKKKALEKFYQLKKQLRDNDFKQEQDNTDKQIELERKKNEAILSLTNELRGFVFDIFKGQVDSQINQVQGLIDELEKQKQKEIEVANSTISNAQERADAIAVIEARANAKREQYELKQRQLQYEKAKYERQATITEIIQNTAVAVIKALSEGGKDKWLMTGIIAATGAAQLARVLATPIPKYRYGTGDEDHPGGLAIVGDGGKSEAVKLPTGDVYKTPATSTLTYLPKGTQVFPDYDRYALSASLNGISPKYTNDATNKELLKSSKDIVKAINKLPASLPKPIIYQTQSPVNNWIRGK